ncbi:hypothetical protein KRMM14A1004_18110 [Krasilnikovia sp. MM14-A1004]
MQRACSDDRPKPPRKAGHEGGPERSLRAAAACSFPSGDRPVGPVAQCCATDQNGATVKVDPLETIDVSTPAVRLAPGVESLTTVTV